MKKKAIFCDTVISVLGYQEEGEWVALALEMDLRGYGKTFDDALEELVDCIAMQISFAEKKGHPEMVFHPADSTYYLLFAQVRQDRLQAMGQSLGETEYLAGGMPMPEPHIIDAIKHNGFSQANG